MVQPEADAVPARSFYGYDPTTGKLILVQVDSNGKLVLSSVTISGTISVSNLLNPHPISLSTLLNPHPVSLSSLPNPSNLDVALSTRATGTILNPHPVSLSTLLNPHPVSLASLPNPSNLDVALSTRATEATLVQILAYFGAAGLIDVALSSRASEFTLLDIRNFLQALTETDYVLDLIKAKTDNLDVALSTRALEAGGNLAAIAAKDFATQTTLALIKAKTDNLDAAISTLFKATQNIGNTSFISTQSTRTNLLMKPEREDLISLGGVASPNAAGVQIVAGSGQTKIKVYDAGYEALAAGLHYFYFGTGTAATTRCFITRKTVGAILKSFVQPRVSDAGDGLYLYSSNSETNMPYDVGYVQE